MPLSNKTMTVAELIEELQQMDPESKVVFAFPYGDRNQTTVAEGVEFVDEGIVRWSDYHNAFEVVDDEDAPDEALKNDLKVVVIQ